MKVQYTEEIIDENNALGLGEHVRIEAELYFSIDPGDQGCWRTRNGDGWPPTPPEAHLDQICIIRIVREDGTEIPLTEDSEDAAVKFVDEDTERRWAEIEPRIFEKAEGAQDDANRADI